MDVVMRGKTRRRRREDQGPRLKKYQLKPRTMPLIKTNLTFRKLRIFSRRVRVASREESRLAKA
jgi:hypothetical protein